MSADQMKDKIDLQQLSQLHEFADFTLWRGRNYAPPSPHFVKQQVLIRQGIANGLLG